MSSDDWRREINFPQNGRVFWGPRHYDIVSVQQGPVYKPFVAPAPIAPIDLSHLDKPIPPLFGNAVSYPDYSYGAPVKRGPMSEAEKKVWRRVWVAGGFVLCLSPASAPFGVLVLLGCGGLKLCRVVKEKLEAFEEERARKEAAQAAAWRSRPWPDLEFIAQLTALREAAAELRASEPVKPGVFGRAILSVKVSVFRGSQMAGRLAQRVSVFL